MPPHHAKKDSGFRFVPGDRVVAFDQTGLRLQGTVESVALKQRILWIHTSAGDRKLLDSKEHVIEMGGRTDAGGEGGQGEPGPWPEEKAGAASQAPPLEA